MTGKLKIRARLILGFAAITITLAVAVGIALWRLKIGQERSPSNCALDLT